MDHVAKSFVEPENDNDSSNIVKIVRCFRILEIFFKSNYFLFTPNVNFFFFFFFFFTWKFRLTFPDSLPSSSDKGIWDIWMSQNILPTVNSASKLNIFKIVFIITLLLSHFFFFFTPIFHFSTWQIFTWKKWKHD